MRAASLTPSVALARHYKKKQRHLRTSLGLGGFLHNVAPRPKQPTLDVGFPWGTVMPNCN